MKKFYCERCGTEEVDWPRSLSVDENGAEMPHETTEQAHMRGHAEMDMIVAMRATDWPKEA